MSGDWTVCFDFSSRGAVLADYLRLGVGVFGGRKGGSRRGFDDDLYDGFGELQWLMI